MRSRATRRPVRMVGPGYPLAAAAGSSQAVIMTDPDVRIELVDVHDDRQVADHHDVLLAAYRHVSPDHPMASLPELLAQLRTERAAVTVETWVMYAGTEPVATYRLTLPQRDNTRLAELELGVHPRAPAAWPRPGAGGPPSRAVRRARPDAGQHRGARARRRVAEPGDAIRRRDRRHQLARRGASGPGPHRARPQPASPPCGPRRRAGRATTTWSAGPGRAPTTWSRPTPP